jgi:imipenem/basic amino acid-specific outer membrane pore
MRVMKWSMIALAVTAASTQLAMAAPFVGNQADAKGFVEDSKFDLLLRNYYFNRDKKDGVQDDKDWTQGIHGVFSSGYTQGTVGFGVDAFGYFGVLLDGDDKYSGSGNITRDSQGRNHDNFGKAGAAV